MKNAQPFEPERIAKESDNESQPRMRTRIADTQPAEYSEHHQSVTRLLIVLIGSVFAIELLVMFLLPLLPAMSRTADNLLDATLLSALLFPVFYYLIFRPLVRNLAERKQIVNELRHEVAEHQKSELELTKYMDKLKNSNQELDEFAYIAAHDLKEPLRGIHNYASFLKEDYNDRLDDDGRNYIERIQRLAERQTTLIDRLLAYSRIGRTELAFESTEVGRIVDNVTEDLRPFLESQHAELRRTTSLPRLKCDPVRIGEVFQNLIVNGVKYNDRADKWVEVGCEPKNGSPIFYVRDNGIGISPQHQDIVFRIFKRLHEQHKYGGGTGAGLTIVKKIVERHGGRIWLESAPGQGTTFYFTLNGETSWQ
jgi:light-regulated signal transduction histidine kinase (bacteriophytochrome)